MTETKRSNGSSLWNIFTNASQVPSPQPGGGTGYLEIYHYVPPTLAITAGDTVEWTALNVHTVTFPAAGQDPATIDPFGTQATTNATYDGTSMYHSGLLAWFEPGSPTTYSLTFPDAGTFAYICAPSPAPRADGRDRGERRTGRNRATHGRGRVAITGLRSGQLPGCPSASLAVLSACIATAALAARRR